MWCSHLPPLREVQQTLRVHGYTILPLYVTPHPPSLIPPSNSASSFIRIPFQIQGIRCTSCTVAIEHLLKKLEGAQEIRVDGQTGNGEMLCSSVPSLHEAQDILQANGYTLLPRNTPSYPPSLANPLPLSPAYRQFAPVKEVLFQIRGIHCASCELVIEHQLKTLEGVQEVRVNAQTGKGAMFMVVSAQATPSTMSQEHSQQ